MVSSVSEEMRRSTLAAGAISIGALVLLIIWANPARLVATLLTAHPLPLALAVVLAVVSLALRVVKWWILIRPVPLKIVTPVQLFGLTISNITPGKVGEPAKAVLLKMRAGVPVSVSLPSVMWERIIDLLVVGLLGLLALILLPWSGSVALLGVAGIVLFILLASVAILILYSRRFGRWIFAYLRRLPLLKKISPEFLHTFYQSSMKPARLSACVAATIGVWVVDGLILWLSLDALGVQQNVLLLIGIFALSVIAGFVSFLPGGLGSSEIVLTALLVLVGITQPIAVAAVLITRFLTFWFAGLAGVCAMFQLGKNIDLKALGKQW